MAADLLEEANKYDTCPQTFNFSSLYMSEDVSLRASLSQNFLDGEGCTRLVTRWGTSCSLHFPSAPTFPSPVLSCCLPWRETHNSFMLPVYHPSHHLVVPLSLAAAVGRLHESASINIHSFSEVFHCIIYETKCCSFSANYLQHLAKVENIACKSSKLFPQGIMPLEQRLTEREWKTKPLPNAFFLLLFCSWYFSVKDDFCLH